MKRGDMHQIEEWEAKAKDEAKLNRELDAAGLIALITIVGMGALLIGLSIGLWRAF
jgi:hypothetical protein